MPDIETTALRGFDSYEVKLGDELRGHRASLGKSLLDVQRDLRIRASYIDAIENCDASVIPNKGFVAGYVRAYARYLLLDPEEIYARFRAESGFVGSGSGGGAAQPAGSSRLSGLLTGAASATGSGAGPAYDPSLARNHFSAPLGSARRVGVGVSMSGLASVAVLGGLVFGLAYGGWLLVEDIQRVAFAPSPDAPEIAEAPPVMSIPGLSLQALADSAPILGAEHEAALAALYAPRDISAPDIALRDGPIATIDPEEASLFGPGRGRPTALAERAAPDVRPPGTSPLRESATLAALDAGDEAGAGRAAASSAQDAAAGPAQPQAQSPAQSPAQAGVWILVADDAWLRVRTRDGSTLVQRIFKPGERFRLPDDAVGASLRAGNAGGVYIQVDGEIRGPLGPPGGVVKRVPLTRDAVRAAFELAAETDLAAPPPAPTVRTQAELALD